jgi:hypothetical protein
MKALKSIGMFIGGAIASIAGLWITLYITGLAVHWSLVVYEATNNLFGSFF